MNVIYATYTCCLLLAVMNCTSSEPKTNFINTEELVRLEITEFTTEKELTEIADILIKDRDIELDISESEFDANGNIITLLIKVDCQDGFKGRTHAERRMLSHATVGFYRDYRPGAKSAFGTGPFTDEE